MLKRLKLPPPHPMIFPYDIWYIILPHTTLLTLLKCRCLCKKVYKIGNFVIKTSQKEINWIKVSKNPKKLSEDFIREFQDKVDWGKISCNQILSEDFIREFKDKVDWWWISHYQTLSEDFIREFKNQVNWRLIYEYQILSENFIREFYSGRNKSGLVFYIELSKVE